MDRIRISKSWVINPINIPESVQKAALDCVEFKNQRQGFTIDRQIENYSEDAEDGEFWTIGGCRFCCVPEYNEYTDGMDSTVIIKDGNFYELYYLPL